MKNEKLNKYQLTYINGIGDKISILIEAENRLNCIRIFREQYGMYFIVEVIKIN